jgi:hypothetical protein
MIERRICLVAIWLVCSVSAPLFVQALATLASDLDYVRGINSWRAGVMLYGDWYDSDSVNNALGTYTVSNIAAYQAGQPILDTRQIGDPSISFFNARARIYLQDDLRVRKGLTPSPGLRAADAGRQPRVRLTWG